VEDIQLLGTLFSTWERELTNLGLMEKDERGKSFIPPAKLWQILNFDETSLLLNGSLINWRGWPAVYWFDPRHPQVEIMTIKTTYLSTMITPGSNAYSKALPPHFQITSSAQSDKGKQIRSDCVCYMQNVVGEFGLGQTTLCPATFGMNKKGGISMVESWCPSATQSCRFILMPRCHLGSGLSSNVIVDAVGWIWISLQTCNLLISFCFQESLT
jgi:hypothetical protein